LHNSLDWLARDTTAPDQSGDYFSENFQAHPPNPPPFCQRFFAALKTLSDSANSECCRSGICIALTTEAKKSPGACWAAFAAVGTDERKKQHSARRHEQQT